MPVITPIPPAALLAAFKMAGWRVHKETENIWAMLKDGESEPFIIPRSGSVVGMELMSQAQSVEGLKALIHNAAADYTSSPQYKIDLEKD